MMRLRAQCTADGVRISSTCILSCQACCKVGTPSSLGFAFVLFLVLVNCVHRFTYAFLGIDWVWQNWQKSLKLAVCPVTLLILLTLSVHLLRRYRGSLSHNWRIILAVFKSFMYCMPVMAFLACSRTIENSCYPVPSSSLTAGHLDSLAMYALTILYG